MLPREREIEPLEVALEPVLAGLGMALVELTVSRHKGGASVRAVVCRAARMPPVTQAESLPKANSPSKSGKPNCAGTDAVFATGLDDCARAHRAIMPRLELALGPDVPLEVSSPGIERKLKHAGEFRHFTGRAVACYRTDISDWTTGILEEAGETGIDIRENGVMIHLDYSVISKAKLALGGPNAALGGANAALSGPKTALGGRVP